MLKKATGEMYEWVTHTHSALMGECPHGCSYCYVRAMAKRFPAMKSRYSGPLRLDAKAMKDNFGMDKVIFIENCNDLFAEEVPSELIRKILNHCLKFAGNKYILQTKNPSRYYDFTAFLPVNLFTLGTTIETNRDIYCSIAPSPKQRAQTILDPRSFVSDYKRFVTIEPIMDFDLDVFLVWFYGSKISFVNIGADSKGHNLPEPPKDKILALIDGLKVAGIEVRLKSNLRRLLT